MDILTFVLWLVGIVTGYVALSRFKISAGVIDRSRAIAGLVLAYFGSSFGIIAGVGNQLLVTAGIGGGLLYKAFPFINK